MAVSLNSKTFTTTALQLCEPDMKGAKQMQKKEKESRALNNTLDVFFLNSCKKELFRHGGHTLICVDTFIYA
jgi:hypothetical protein